MRWDAPARGASHTRKRSPAAFLPLQDASLRAYESDGLDPNGELSEDARMSESQVRGATPARTKDPYSIDAVRARLKEEVRSRRRRSIWTCGSDLGSARWRWRRRRCRASAPFPMGHRALRGGRHAARCALAAGLAARRRRLRLRRRPRLAKVADRPRPPVRKTVRPSHARSRCRGRRERLTARASRQRGALRS